MIALVLDVIATVTAVRCTSTTERAIDVGEDGRRADVV